MMPGQGRWALAVHGGAKLIAPDAREGNRRGCLAALAAGRTVLTRGGSAIDAVEAAVRILEADPTFNAGKGSALTGEGEIEMCAAIMSGVDLAVGAVGVIKAVRHPISVARLLMPEDEILVAGPGARRFAAEKGAELCDPEELVVEKQRRELAEHDTVGAVALDTAGNLAAATSTGGLPGAKPGRMADSALPGCGYYADNAIGALALSGKGEAIARLAISSEVIRLMPEIGPEAALERPLSKLPHLGGDGGGIAIRKDGAIGWWHNSPHFAVATASAAQPAGRVWLNKDEA
ncbi:isoaspartyl peptidase/L-asparaginase family protein [Sphingosinicella terrae]|uniref:isoaspartyl peptidase/L-asparaginase family protein n=1 Tax=Sphingosinicella terrae TaxID=2172047 RepID=UPI0025480D1D|nr:isoaspartyl peptidase/L-asparaginase family protein [Sphingosinicella terrae]